MRIRHTRRWLLLVGFGAPVWTCAAAPPALEPVLDGVELRVAAPRLHVLSGAPLERLKNGAPVGFSFQLVLGGDSNFNPLARAVERFVVSYDLWEEKFSVMRVGRQRRSVSHLTAVAAETWCLDNLAVLTAGIALNRPVWLRLEVRADDARDGLGVVDEPGINLTRLVDIFSRPPRPTQPRWQIEAGPVLLAEAPRAAPKPGRFRFR